MFRVGAPGVCTAIGVARKPPVAENCPLVIFAPAVGWPIVPRAENTPPVLVPPPAPMENQPTENWALTELEIAVNASMRLKLVIFMAAGA